MLKMFKISDPLLTVVIKSFSLYWLNDAFMLQGTERNCHSIKSNQIIETLAYEFIAHVFSEVFMLIITYPLMYIPDSRVHGANMGPTWVLSAPDGPHVGLINLAIRDDYFHIDLHHPPILWNRPILRPPLCKFSEISGMASSGNHHGPQSWGRMVQSHGINIYHMNQRWWFQVWCLCAYMQGATALIRSLRNRLWKSRAISSRYQTSVNGTDKEMASS